VMPRHSPRGVDCFVSVTCLLGQMYRRGHAHYRPLSPIAPSSLAQEHWRCIRVITGGPVVAIYIDNRKLS
jgi:hypothetical protein